MIIIKKKNNNSAIERVTSERLYDTHIVYRFIYVFF